MDGQGNLERAWKVREFESKWLYGRQTSENLLIYSVQVGKICNFSWDSLKPICPLIGGNP